jgi:DNA-directed RNA polymerase specialized sigma24 family protein
MRMGAPNIDDFDSTQWTKLHLAAHGDGKLQENSLNELARAYAFPIQALARKLGIDSQLHDELVQATMAAIFSPTALSRVDGSKGRFRDYVAGALRRQWASFFRRELSQKRDARRNVPLSMELMQTIAAPSDWEVTFDQDRAIHCLDAVRATMEKESSNPLQFAVAWNEILQLDGRTQQAQAAELDISAEAYRQRLHVLRDRFRRLFRAQVAKGLLDPSELDEEWRYLLKLAWRKLSLISTD